MPSRVKQGVVNKSYCSFVFSCNCSQDCIFCGPLGQYRFKSEEYLLQVRDRAYAAIKEFRDGGYDKIEVSGLDPIEFEGLAEYIGALRSAGFKWVRISTHGSRLSDIGFARKLLKENVDLFRIPLYGATAQAHDAITRTRGSFDRTVQGIRNIKAIGGTKVLLTSLLFRQNCLELCRIFDLMVELGADEMYFSPVLISNNDYSYYIPSKFQGPFFQKLVRHAAQRHRRVEFKDVPYCVFGFDNDFVNNQWQPAHLAQGSQVAEVYRTFIQDLPRYRMKAQVAMCKACAVNDKCDGFLVNDLKRFDLKGLKPVKRRCAA